MTESRASLCLCILLWAPRSTGLSTSWWDTHLVSAVALWEELTRGAEQGGRVGGQSRRRSDARVWFSSFPEARRNGGSVSLSLAAPLSLTGPFLLSPSPDSAHGSLSSSRWASAGWRWGSSSCMGPTSSKQETGEQNRSLADSVPTTLGLTPTLPPLFFLPSILPTHSLELCSLLDLVPLT